MKLWNEILERPNQLADEYEKLWHEQHPNRKEYFFRVRDEFNSTHLPHHLLYLLARIVKGSVRYSADGLFNQSADNRRSGMRPNTMRQNIMGVSYLLADKTSVSAVDFREIVKETKEVDLVYMDPPYQGTSFTRDHRYYNGVTYDDFVDALYVMNKPVLCPLSWHMGTLKNPVFRRVLRVVDELLAGLYRHGSKMRVILYDSLCSVAVRPVFRRFKR